jgi:6-phosphofructokinase 1
VQKNLLVAHGGGPTAVINASLAGVIGEARRSGDVDRILAARHGIEGLLRGEVIDLTGLGDADLERLARTPGSAIGSCRYRVAEQDHPRIARALEELGAGFFFYNGGNDSMDTCARVAALDTDARIVGIPKTIDNDLARTDHCPGFGSAARYYAVSAAELALDVRALPIHVVVLETMGRNAGWLAASCALAREIEGLDPEMILLPERPFDEEAFLEAVRRHWERGRGFVIAASEGVAGADGRPLVESTHAAGVDGFGHRLPGGVGQYLADLITERLDIRARAEKPGLLGRVSQLLASEVDRREALEVGRAAARAAAEGMSGVMVALQRVSSEPYSSRTVLVPLDEVANVERRMPDRYIRADGLGVEAEFLDYVRPLVGGELPQPRLIW